MIFYISITIQDIFTYVLGQDDVLCTRMAVPPFLVSKSCPFNFFFKNSCMRHDSVAIQDIFMQFYRNVY